MSSTHRRDPLIGSLLDGRYRVVSFLGRGGMGNVYVAEETRLRRRCALKVLHPHLVDDPVHVERFLREAQMIAQFKHPNIVDIFASGEEPSGLVFFAMELLEGEDLDARLAARGERPFTARDCCMWGVQVARAVGVVHAAGLIHRDLKTSNIFLARRYDGEEIVKLLDFGIARREERSDLTGTGVAIGTPSYMAPEQFTDSELDRRTDIYAFGVMLYRLLTGQLPFTGDPMQLCLKHRDVQPARPSKVAPEAGISAKMEAVVLKCLAKRPAERYPSMKAVEDALVAASQQEELALGSGVRGRLATLWDRKAPTVPTATVRGPSPPMESVTLPLLANQTGKTEPSAPAPLRRARFPLVLTTGVLGLTAVLGAASLIRDESSGSAEVDASASGSVAVGPAELPERAPGHNKSDVVSDEAAPRVDAPMSTGPGAPVTQELGPSAEGPAQRDAEAPELLLEEAGPAKVQRPPPRATARPSHPGRAVTYPTDPMQQVRLRARECRRKFKAVDGLRMVIRYWVGADGEAHGATPSVDNELGACLAAAVSSTRFEPKLALSKQIEL